MTPSERDVVRALRAGRPRGQRRERAAARPLAVAAGPARRRRPVHGLPADRGPDLRPDRGLRGAGARLGGRRRDRGGLPDRGRRARPRPHPPAGRVRPPPGAGAGRRRPGGRRAAVRELRPDVGLRPRGLPAQHLGHGAQGGHRHRAGVLRDRGRRPLPRRGLPAPGDRELPRRGRDGRAPEPGLRAHRRELPARAAPRRREARAPPDRGPRARERPPRPGGRDDRLRPRAGHHRRRRRHRDRGRPALRARARGGHGPGLLPGAARPADPGGRPHARGHRRAARTPASSASPATS